MKFITYLTIPACVTASQGWMPFLFRHYKDIYLVI